MKKREDLKMEVIFKLPKLSRLPSSVVQDIFGGFIITFSTGKHSSYLYFFNQRKVISLKQPSSLDDIQSAYTNQASTK